MGPPTAGSPQAVCAVRHGEGATTACAAEPRVKIRYVADDRGGESSQKNSVEVYIDDVLVHEQALPQERDLSGSEFKAGASQTHLGRLFTILYCNIFNCTKLHYTVVHMILYCSTMQYNVV